MKSKMSYHQLLLLVAVCVCTCVCVLGAPYDGLLAQSPSRVRRQTQERGLSDQQKQDLLDLHNEMRRSDRNRASNMIKLRWNDYLADLAQEWADSCEYEHGGTDIPASAGLGYTRAGQNLYINSRDEDVTRGVQRWYDEIEFYDYDRNRCDTGEVCGHYTQIVWADTYEVGCGYRRACDADSNGNPLGEFDFYYLVCNYGPAGNINTDENRPYEEGRACSNCPSGFPDCEEDLCTGDDDTPPAANTTPNPEDVVFACDFEDEDICSFTQSSRDDGDWEVNEGRTSTANTGPDSAVQGRYYLHIDGSDFDEGETARLDFPTVDVSGAACLRFAYHMSGANIGTLEVAEVSEGTLFQQSGEQGDEWLRAQIDLNMARSSQYYILVIDRARSAGDIAIDDVTIAVGSCSGGGGGDGDVLYSCDFEDDFCDATQSNRDDGEWERNTGRTSTTDTGPGDAGTDSGEWYIYMEDSTIDDGQTVRLDLPRVDHSGSVCIRFQYYMYGENVQTLEIGEVSDGPLLTLRGDQGQQWHQGQVRYLADRIMSLYITATGSDTSKGDIAIDNIRITAGDEDCEEGEPPVDTPDPVSLPYECSFERTALCDITQSQDDELQWRRTEGRTPTSGTGPDEAYDGRYYVYMEADDGRERDEASFITPPIDYSGTVCLRYALHMSGDDADRLTIELEDVGRISEMRDDQGEQWEVHEVEFDVQTRQRIVFTARRGRSNEGDIAVDDLRITRGPCEPEEPEDPEPVRLPYTCGFEESGLCGMVQASNDDMDWIRTRSSTPTSGTGPDDSTEGRYYLYVEADDGRRGDVARLLTPPIDESGTVCVVLYYHMRGRHVGSLDVRVGAEGDVILRQSGDQGAIWLPVNTEVNIRRNEQIVITAIRGSGSVGDIAIDGFRITDGRCPSDSTTTPASTPQDLEFVTVGCDMEEAGDTGSDCIIRQATRGDDFDWSRGTATTPSGEYVRILGYERTGPPRAAEGSYYIYTEASGTNRGDVARLTVQDPMLNERDTQYCLRFDYSMNGFHMGRLVILNSVEKRWELYGNQGQGWHNAAVDLTTGTDDEINVEGIMRGGVNGDMALDNIRFIDGACGGRLPRGVLFQCDFEIESDVATMCNLRQPSTDDFDWTLWTGATPSRLTGPNIAYRGTYYIHIEASKPQQENDIAEIFFPPSTYSGDACIEFAYHMHGHHTRSLQVIVVDDRGREREVELYEGEMGQSWGIDALSVTLRRGDQVGFRGRVGSDYSGDIALDAIVVSEGDC